MRPGPSLSGTLTSWCTPVRAVTPGTAITAMLHNRKEAITFEKLKAAVQQMLRKTFTVGYLKQIKTVFPEAYRSE